MSEVTQKQIAKFEAAVPVLNTLVADLTAWNETSPDERRVAQQNELKATWKAAKNAVRKSGLALTEEGDLVAA